MIRSLVGATVAVLALGVITTMALAANRGPNQIEIYGGSEGKVPFPHAQHQKVIKDCKVCHGVFPQETDAIKTLKEKGVLKKKKVMNRQCIKCHRKEKRAGNPHGPLKCSTCHVK